MSETQQTMDVPTIIHEQNVTLCKGCDLAVALPSIGHGKSAHCPRCNTKLAHGGSRRRQPLTGNLALAVTCLLLFIPSHFFPFISIRLIGNMIPATLPSGSITLMQEGFVGLGLLILFCSSIAPLLLCSAVVVSHLALRFRRFTPLRYSLLVIHRLKQWMMLDVFLVSVAISCFKLQDYSDIFVGVGLYGVILLQIVTLMLIARISTQTYWEHWQKEADLSFDNKSAHCSNCHLSQPVQSRCTRCYSRLSHRKPQAIQKTWALLIAASACFIPANIIPISILFNNGQRIEDTIFSGVANLVTSNMYGIALIIFVASIVVPAAKIIGVAYLLISIQYRHSRFRRQRMMIYFVVKWIGKWSVMDLFVISIMMTLVDRGQILNFSPGYGAVAFGAVVVLTMLATDSFDPRLIWDAAEPRARLGDEQQKEPSNDPVPQSTQPINISRESR